MTFTRTIQSSATSSGVAAFELIAGPKDIILREIGVSLVNATTSIFGLGRPGAKGVTPTSPVSLQSFVPSSKDSMAKLAVAWGTGPTIPSIFLRRISLPATIGAQAIWRFADSVDGTTKGGLLIPKDQSIIIWTLSSVSVADIYVNIEE